MKASITPLAHRIRHRVRSWPRRVVISVAVILVLLVLARVALPVVVKRQVNARLAGIPGYVGQVEDIDLHLWRGAYALSGLSIYRQNGTVRVPFVLARKIDFSVDWRELFHRKIVSDILVDGGQLTFVKAVTEEASQTDADRRWQEVINDLFPIDITHFELRDGFLRYQDTTKTPPVDVYLKNLHLVATGLRNRPGEGKSADPEFPAEISIKGETLGGGRVELLANAEPLAEQPHFHLSASVEDVNLPDLNDSLKGMANVDVGRGTFRMAAEMAGRDGGFQGYVKPFFENLDFNNIEDQHASVGTRLWEKIVSGLAWLVKNKARDQVGTRIPFSGRFGDSQVGLWATVANLFRHGFIRAFNPTVEGTVHADNVLPNGKSVDGQDVAKSKVDDPGDRKRADQNRAGAPTAR